MKILPVTILLALLLNLPSNRLWAQESLVSNIAFNVDSQKVNVFYDLDGSLTQKYRVTAKLRLKDSTFTEYPVSSYQGQLGTDVSVGYNNKFEWNYKDDINFIPNTIDHEFIFVVEPITTSNQNTGRNQKKEDNKSSSGSTWYYYVGGAVVLVVTLALTVFRPADKTTDEDPIPNPPKRPGEN